MDNNYTPSYNQYLTQTAGYALPSSVRSYSVFDPNSNSWRRMTNDGRSPMPAQGQTPVADALALARQTQGRDWSAQPAPVQAPAQTPLGGPRMASPASGGGVTVVPMGQGRNVSPRASQGQIPVLPGEGAVQAPSTLYQGMGKTQEGGTVYTPLAAADNRPDVRDMIAVTREGIAVPAVSFGTPANTVAIARTLAPTVTQPKTQAIQPLPVANRTYQDVIPNDTIDVTANMRDNDDDTVYDPNAPSMYSAGTPEQHAEFKRKLENFLEGTAAVATLGAPAFPYIGARIAASPVGAAVGKGLAKFGKGFRDGTAAAWKNYKNALTLGENTGVRGFSRYTSKNPIINKAPSAEVQAQRLAEYQNRLNPAPFSYGTPNTFPFGF